MFSDNINELSVIRQGIKRETVTKALYNLCYTKGINDKTVN